MTRKKFSKNFIFSFRSCLKHMTQRLQNYFFEKILPKWANDYPNIYQVPRLKKIVLNRGLGDASRDTKILDSSLQEFQKITGQKAIIQYSKKSIATFHLRKKMPVGITVTLRRHFMYGFLDRLVNLALPRIRDFSGLSLQSFDGYGNYNFGLDEQLMFPEIKYDQVQQIRGMDITIVTTGKTDKEGLTLLQAFGLPFQKSLIQDTTSY
uniref:Large ribosomal subunit protein uL5c n=1 Tax=Tydemania expeditionis TaxID=325645 RepID=A0A0D6E299_TYDEX|nr:ribosomal protein L5 [Tydemania expeditionis]CEO91125.1 ribosomal protein L5 [Tydemania expeditionis]